MNGTQVTDIAKKVDYPRFKKGLKINVESSNDDNITEVLSDNIEEGKVNYLLAQKISDNMKAESEAIAFYNELLSFIDDNSDKKQIEEIISDEKNHLMVLSEMLKKYDGNIPVAKD